MSHRVAYTYTLAFVLTTLIVGPLYFTSKAQATTPNLAICAVQITGGEGHTTDDFVKLCNPTSGPLDLKGLRLVKRTASGTKDTTIKSWTTTTTIPAGGSYVWANSGYTTLTPKPNTTTSETLANDNGLALRLGAANTGAIIDAVSWGAANNGLAEGSPYPENPGANQKLLRIVNPDGNFQDTENNAQDFILEPRAVSGTSTKATPTSTTKNSSTTATGKTNTSSRSGYETIAGTVAVSPGVLGASILFLAEPALQLNLTSEAWPTLIPGDVVSVHGKISHTITYGTRLMLDSASDLTLLKHTTPPEPKALGLAEITTQQEANLISTSGKVVQISSTSFTLEADSKRLHANLKNREVTWPKLRIGQQVSLTGFVTLSRGEIRFWVRSPADIKIAPVAAAGDTYKNAVTNLEQREEASTLPGYLLLGTLAAVLIGSYLWTKFKLPLPRELFRKLIQRS